MPSETKKKSDDLDNDDDDDPSASTAADAERKRPRAADNGDDDEDNRRGGAKPEARDRKDKDARPADKAARPGFFTVYKPGQGFWTRVGTYAGAGLIGFLVALHIYIYLPPALPKDGVLGLSTHTFSLILAAVFLVIYAAFMWRLVNKPDNVDFLIATDSEMKKVNWTSRKELIGSTKVVILFMVFIAVFLYVCDLLFGFLFWSTGVLRFKPFGY